ncbi:hypothetical protein ACQVP2_30125 [Methylobacterium aquaticum]|uniref:hypothetical protein n=1 Tax=Methylobacterium aquaticum TaxID=270351 RepID=UPI003D182B0D
MSFRSGGDGRLGVGSLGIGEDALSALVALVVLACRRARRTMVALPGGFDENKVSVQVHQELQTVQDRFNLRWLEFHLEGVLNPPGRVPTKTVGRIDFKVKLRQHHGYPNAYFGVEGKRVSPGDTALARYYMQAGVGKFAAGTYSDGHPEAVLLGYLLAPPVTAVLDDIRRRLARLHGAAATLRPWGPRYRDAQVVEGMVPRVRGGPIRLLHAIVRMHA